MPKPAGKCCGSSGCSCGSSPDVKSKDKEKDSKDSKDSDLIDGMWTQEEADFFYQCRNQLKEAEKNKKKPAEEAAWKDPKKRPMIMSIPVKQTIPTAEPKRILMNSNNVYPDRNYVAAGLSDVDEDGTDEKAKQGSGRKCCCSKK